MERMEGVLIDSLLLATNLGVTLQDLDQRPSKVREEQKKRKLKDFGRTVEMRLLMNIYKRIGKRPHVDSLIEQQSKWLLPGENREALLLTMGYIADANQIKPTREQWRQILEQDDLRGMFLLYENYPQLFDREDIPWVKSMGSFFKEIKEEIIIHRQGPERESCRQWFFGTPEKQGRLTEEYLRSWWSRGESPEKSVRELEGIVA